MGGRQSESVDSKKKKKRFERGNKNKKIKEDATPLRFVVTTRIKIKKNYVCCDKYMSVMTNMGHNILLS